MAATLVLSNSAKALVVNALKESLRYVFLGKNTSINVGATLKDVNIHSSDGSTRVKHLSISAITTEYRTENDLGQNDENRITNFYIRDGVAVNKLVLMDALSSVHGIITFPTITPTETKSLYVPEIKISVL